MYIRLGVVVQLAERLAALEILQRAARAVVVGAPRLVLRAPAVPAVQEDYQAAEAAVVALGLRVELVVAVPPVRFG